MAKIIKFFLYRFFTICVLIAFIINMPLKPVYAQVSIALPPAGQIIHPTNTFAPPQMIGLKVNLKDPFNFDFIMDQGQTSLSATAEREEFNKIIKYFLVSLTMPNKDMWVNLSPYESHRIIPEVFGKTEMGRDLLAQDYMLKQFTASLMYPENGLGKEFWNKVYAQAQARFGTTNININTFNKVWILADKANIYQKGDTAFLINSHLKVMLEQDYMAIQKNKEQFGNVPMEQGIHLDAKTKMASELVREIIIPAIEKEVNEGKNFSAVRQVYSAEILATWFKKTLRASLLGQAFADQSKIAGQKIADPKAMEEIYQQYLKAYKKGVFNYIKDDPTPDGQAIPRKYFSGGILSVDGAMIAGASLSMAKDWGARLLESTNDRLKVVSCSLVEKWDNFKEYFAAPKLLTQSLKPGKYDAFVVEGKGVAWVAGSLEVAEGKNGHIVIGKRIFEYNKFDKWSYFDEKTGTRQIVGEIYKTDDGVKIGSNNEFEFIAPGVHSGIEVLGEGVHTVGNVLEGSASGAGGIVVGTNKLVYADNQWNYVDSRGRYQLGEIKKQADGLVIGDVKFETSKPEEFNLTALNVPEESSPVARSIVTPLKSEYVAWQKTLDNAKLKLVLIKNYTNKIDKAVERINLLRQYQTAGNLQEIFILEGQISSMRQQVQQWVKEVNIQSQINYFDHQLRTALKDTDLLPDGIGVDKDHLKESLLNARNTAYRQYQEYLDIYNDLRNSYAARSTSHSTPRTDKAMLDEVGGINLSDENLTLNIKVDGKGMPLPEKYQDSSMINFNGLVSIIRKIVPVSPQNVPALYELGK